MRRIPLLTTIAVSLAFAAVPAALAAHDHGGGRPGGAPGFGADRPERPERAPRPDDAPRPGQDRTFPTAASAAPTFNAGAPRGPRRRGAIVTRCDYALSGMFDPIVFPGQAETGHMHDFFGALSIGPDSTPADLREANTSRDDTTCSRAADGSAYWVPGLMADGETVLPRSVRAKYRPARSRTGRTATFPADFRVVRGDKAATTPQRGIGYRCADDDLPLAAEVPTCPDGELVAVVRFASCWDGVNAFLPGSAHVAMPGRRGACPATHPVSLPELTLEVAYATDGLPHVWTLHSGSTAGYHADFMNGWEPAAIARLAGRPRRI